MTRREEIEKVANEFYKGDEVSTFVVAAQWADKTMIDKICNFIIAFNERAKLGIIEPLINVEIFRKAMEE